MSAPPRAVAAYYALLLSALALAADLWWLP